jgi:hypothetical protein
MIYQGYFDEIQLHCLIQGHTHIDIDQIFSTIARAFWIACITTLSIFKAFVKLLFKHSTQTPDFTTVYNWTDFFEGNYCNSN